MIMTSFDNTEAIKWHPISEMPITALISFIKETIEDPIMTMAFLLDEVAETLYTEEEKREYIFSLSRKTVPDLIYFFLTTPLIRSMVGELIDRGVDIYRVIANIIDDSTYHIELLYQE